MSHPVRMRRRIAAPGAVLGATAVVATLAWGGSAAQAARTTPSGLPEAVDFVVGQLVDGNHVESGGYPQYGQTVDVAAGLAAAGGAADTLDAVTAYLTTPETVGAYTQGVPFDGEGSAYAGATGKLGLVTTLLGLDPTDIGGADLVAQLQSLEQPSGRFSDRSDYGDFSNVLGQSFDVLFLTAASGAEPSEAAVQFLLDAQCSDGGFPIDFGGADECESSPDATGLAIQALNADDPDEGAGSLPPAEEDALVAAVRWLESSRDDAGAWHAFDAENVNATAYAAMGLLGVAQTAEQSIEWLYSLQQPDGGLPISPGGTSDLYATAQALTPLASTAFVTLDTEVLAPMIEVPAVEPTESPTPTESPSVTPTPTSTTTSTIEPTASGTPHPTLPPTGGGRAAVPLAGLGMLLAGAGVIVAARRLAGRP